MSGYRVWFQYKDEVGKSKEWRAVLVYAQGMDTARERAAEVLAEPIKVQQVEELTCH